MFSTDDSRYMSRALQLAQRGLYTTRPNPRVGCVIVKDDRIVGEGWHQVAGEGHAEVHALAAAGENARGATLYVTLEPCAHKGRTPPCANALIEAGIAEVVSAMEDPNPQVAGKGNQRLRDAGIAVRSGLLADQAEALNAGFLKRMRVGVPFVRLKSGISTDARTAMASPVRVNGHIRAGGRKAVWTAQHGPPRTQLDRSGPCALACRSSSTEKSRRSAGSSCSRGAPQLRFHS